MSTDISAADILNNLQKTVCQVKKLEGSTRAGAAPSSRVLVEDVGSDVEVHVHCSIK